MRAPSGGAGRSTALPVPHTEAAIEALAAGIASRGMLQKQVVEPKTNEADEPARPTPSCQA